MAEMKAFLLYETREWSSRCDEAIIPECVVCGTTIEEAAGKIGGRVEERGTWDDKEDVVVFPKSLFTPTKKKDCYFPAGELLEYRKDSLYLCILPENREAILHFMKLPLFK